MKKTTMESFWAGIEGRARELGAQDSDVAQLRSKTKNLLISADWSDTSGNVTFSSDNDEKNAISAAVNLIEEETGTIIAKRVRNNREIRMGYSPSSSAITAGANPAELQASTFRPAAESAQMSALPGPVTMDTRCTRCGGAMQATVLVNNGTGLYCSKDRIVLPLV